MSLVIVIGNFRFLISYDTIGVSLLISDCSLDLVLLLVTLTVGFLIEIVTGCSMRVSTAKTHSDFATNEPLSGTC